MKYFPKQRPGFTFSTYLSYKFQIGFDGKQILFLLVKEGIVNGTSPEAIPIDSNLTHFLKCLYENEISESNFATRFPCRVPNVPQDDQ